MTCEQIVQALETPLGRYEDYADVVVVAARRRITRLYNDIKKRGVSFSEASLKARAAWLQEMEQTGQFG